jgi:ureidoacrylate peracid hydrolase
MSELPGYASRDVYLELAQRLSPQRTALVVVDMQNDFCAPGGYIDGIGKDVSEIAAIVGPLNAVVDAARAAGVPVVWLAACYDERLLPPAMVAQKRRIGADAICCARGSWGFDFFGVRPAEGEAVFEKNNYSGFSNPNFDRHLRAHGIESLLFCGVQTNVCVESTLREAHSRGYYVAVVEDAVCSHTRPLHEATLANVRFLLGDVITSGDLQASWKPASALAK